MAPFLVWAAAGGVIAVLVALGINLKPSFNNHAGQEQQQKAPQPVATTPDVEPEAQGGDSATNEEPTVYVIGDLHGDVGCGKYWVNRLELADLEGKKWLKPEASVVFLGDYCDKGPYSFQTMHFVKSLTDAFPDKVTALMGNHELELLRDRDEKTNPKYMHLAWSAVHPGEYQHYLTDREWDQQDDLVLDLLLNASLEIYANRWHNSVLLSPTAPEEDERVPITEIFEEELRPLISERLEEYQDAYLKAFASNSTLGQWVESLKVAHIEQGTFFTHGGLHPKFVEEIQAQGGVDALNDVVRQHATTEKFVPFMDTWTGKIVYNMLVYRGNHKEADGCGGLSPMLQDLGVKRLAVGHTPDENVRSLCQDQFWALDSLLGRWIRTSGNMYCPMEKRSSQNGNFVCDAIPTECEGQVVKMTADRVEIIH